MPATPRMVSAKLNLRNPTHRNATNANSATSAMSIAISPFEPTRSLDVWPAMAPASVPSAPMLRTSANVGNRASMFRRPTATTTSQMRMSKHLTPMRRSALVEGMPETKVKGAMMNPATTSKTENENS